MSFQYGRGNARERNVDPTASGRYRDVTKRVPSYVFVGDSLVSRLPNDPTITLTANGGALVNQALPGAGQEGEPNASPLATSAYQYANANAVSHAAPNATVLDFDASQSMSVSLCFRTVNNAFPAATGTLCGKRVTGGTEIGWEVSLNTAGALTLTAKGADLVQKSIGFSQYNTAPGQYGYADKRLHTIDIEFDIEAGEIRAGTDHARTMTAVWTPSSLSTATTFKLGGVRAFAAGPFQLLFLVASFGQQAMKGDPGETALALALDCALSTYVRHNNEQLT